MGKHDKEGVNFQIPGSSKAMTDFQTQNLNMNLITVTKQSV